MKVWIKLTKTSRNKTYVDYKFVDKDDISTEDKQEEIMEQWGENTDGGHVYGYKVYLKILTGMPPLDALEKKIRGKQELIEWTEIKVEGLKAELLELQEERKKLIIDNK